MDSSKADMSRLDPLARSQLDGGRVVVADHFFDKALGPLEDAVAPVVQHDHDESSQGHEHHDLHRFHPVFVVVEGAERLEGGVGAVHWISFVPGSPSICSSGRSWGLVAYG